jgi:hypothetical protein
MASSDNSSTTNSHQSGTTPFCLVLGFTTEGLVQWLSAFLHLLHGQWLSLCWFRVGLVNGQSYDHWHWSYPESAAWQDQSQGQDRGPCFCGLPSVVMFSWPKNTATGWKGQRLEYKAIPLGPRVSTWFLGKSRSSVHGFWPKGRTVGLNSVLGFTMTDSKSQTWI